MNRILMILLTLGCLCIGIVSQQPPQISGYILTNTECYTQTETVGYSPVTRLGLPANTQRPLSSLLSFNTFNNLRVGSELVYIGNCTGTYSYIQLLMRCGLDTRNSIFNGTYEASGDLTIHYSSEVSQTGILSFTFNINLPEGAHQDQHLYPYPLDFYVDINNDGIFDVACSPTPGRKKWVYEFPATISSSSGLDVRIMFRGDGASTTERNCDGFHIMKMEFYGGLATINFLNQSPLPCGGLSFVRTTTGLVHQIMYMLDAPPSAARFFVFGTPIREPVPFFANPNCNLFLEPVSFLTMNSQFYWYGAPLALSGYTLRMQGIYCYNGMWYSSNTLEINGLLCR